MSTAVHQGSIGDFGEPSHLFGKTSLSGSKHASQGASFGTRNSNWGKNIWNSSNNADPLGLTKSGPTNDLMEMDRRGYRSLIDNSQSEDSSRSTSRVQQNALPSSASSSSLPWRNPSFFTSHFNDYSHTPASRTQTTQASLAMSPTAATFGNDKPFGSHDLNRRATQTNAGMFSGDYASSYDNQHPSTWNRYGNSNHGWNAFSSVPSATSKPNSSGSGGSADRSDFSQTTVHRNPLTSSRNGLDGSLHAPSTTGTSWMSAANYGTDGQLPRENSMAAKRAEYNQNPFGTNGNNMRDLGSRFGDFGISDWKSNENVPSQRFTPTQHRSSTPMSNLTSQYSPISPRKQQQNTNPDSDLNWQAMNRGPSERSSRGLSARTESYPLLDSWGDGMRSTRAAGSVQGSNNGMPSSGQQLSTKQDSTAFMLEGDSNEFEIPNSFPPDRSRALSPHQQDQASLLNAQVQQMLMSQMRSQYSRPYNYGIPIDLQGSGVPVYLPMHQMPQIVLPPMQAPPAPELNGAISLRSALLEEFKATNGKGTRGWELKDIYEYMVEFSGDQQGSRLIQSKLETANSEEKERVFHELLPNATQLMQDVFGNYVIQKLFEHGDQHQKKLLAASMRGKILHLTTQVYGCRVVQKALEHILVDEQLSMVRELEHHVLKCVKDQNGNHVIQRAIERIPSEHIQFIINAFKGQIGQLAVHTYGCRVVQRLLEWCNEPIKSLFLQELHASANHLIADQYGNYVTQHVIQHGTEQDRSKLINLVKQHLMTYSKQKFASNVVEKSLIFGTNQDRRDIMHQLCEKDSKGETRLQELIKDQYGNYVIQRILDTLPDHDYTTFVGILTPEMVKAKRLAPNKHAEMIIRKMQKFGCPFTYLNDSSLSLPPMRTGVMHESPSLTTPRSSSVPSSADETQATSNTDAFSIKDGDCGISVSKF